MRVLLIGTGGREHALAARLAEDPAVESLICAPGNPGMARLGECVPVNANDPQAVAALAVTSNADLVVIGPEAPLVAGVADAVRAKNIPVYGPSREAARLEGSKEFAKSVMAAAGVPTAASRVCTSRDEAEVALKEFGAPYVVKDDGLAAGKGVIVTEDLNEALKHAENCERMVVEEYLDGPEVSLFVISDGTNAVPLLPAQDFKRIGEGGTGPNTGGMGAYTPLPWAEETLAEQIMETVAYPTLAEMTRRGTPFVGTLYCGLALTSKGLRVVEFNARFGDPEIQAVLALSETPLAQLLLAAATGKLDEFEQLSWKNASAVCVVMANEGYPGTPAKGRPIKGADGEGIFHAGTGLDEHGRLVATGGRVLNFVGVGETIAAAREESYRKVAGVSLQGGYWRGDIAADL
ncbi:phosphoribosylamine--glycine ligase [Natronoglycomyces albus]|uniref:Phosphoribosylamine--glycine ligase n=1 Tax=Natronoglycomyces albus TaxID=2811108 RepID=A0A895XP52_9ACTN|nr:phosphoribosylamine--glycine ligase [Natronoglycomyces albus]QSB05323.1 phosphoribosylamine--glycine ligase [Natronoglycomyces albus]